MSCLSEEVDTGPVLPLRSLNTDIVRRHPGSTDSGVSLSDQCYCNPTLYVDAHTRLGMFPLHCKAEGYAFKRSLRLHSEEAVHRDEKGGQVVALLEAILQVIILLLRCLEALLRRLVLVG